MCQAAQFIPEAYLEDENLFQTMVWDKLTIAGRKPFGKSVEEAITTLSGKTKPNLNVQ